MKLGAITNGAIGAGITNFGIGLVNKLIKNQIAPIPEPPPDDGLTPPKPLEISHPGNPSSWYSGITKLLSACQNWMANIQNKLTEGILGDENSDPNLLRHMMFMASALIGKMYDLYDYVKTMQENNKNAEKDTFDMAKAAA